MLLLVEGGLLNTGFTVSCDGSLRNTHPLIIQKPMYVSLESLLTRFLSCYWNCRNLTTAGPLHFCERGLPCVCVCVCVISAHRQVLPYSSQSKACLLTTKEGPRSFTLSSIPTQVLPGGLSSLNS